jgi:uncharacterized protein (DUF2147 family)
MDRTQIIAMFAALLLSFCFAPLYAGIETPIGSPVGYWKTVDNITGQPKSIIQIYKSENQILMGKVIKTYSRDGRITTNLCTACFGNQHNQPLEGLVVLSGLKADQHQWGSGKILDPENGKTYNCSMRLTENGKKLKVDGYVGLPLFGHSQTWERVDLMAG